MRIFKFALLSAILFAQACIFADDPEPYASVRNLPQTPYYVPNGYLIFDRINSRSANVFIDVNSLDGGAARYVAQYAPESIVKIYSIQDWLNSNQVQYPYQQFLSNVKHENTTNLIVPIRMNAQEAAAGLSILADVIYLNTTFQEDVYGDILAWSSHLTSDGLICGDNWNNPNVEIGVTQAAASLDLFVHVNGTFWSLEKS